MHQHHHGTNKDIIFLLVVHHAQHLDSLPHLSTSGGDNVVIGEVLGVTHLSDCFKGNDCFQEDIGLYVRVRKV